MNKPHVIIVGAGFTGIATAHDLAMRGFDVTVVERGALVSGTSGRTHGLLHCGGRYAVKDHESAIECIEENQILRKIVPEVIEPGPGLFIAINDSDMAYREAFIKGCGECNIPIKEISAQEVLKLEPNLNPNVQTAFVVPDGTFDPLRLALSFAASAKSNGAKFKLYTEVKEIFVDNSKTDPIRLTAAGKSEYSPINDNITPEGRAKNRRTEIILTPKLDELFKIIETN